MDVRSFVVKKKLLYAAAVAALICLLPPGCASFSASAFYGPGNYYSDTVAVGVKRGEATSTVWLGLLGDGNYPPVERVAKDNGISKLATVEHYFTPGFLFLWIDYTTIVTGE
jgi:hypothetical protein